MAVRFTHFKHAAVGVALLVCSSVPAEADWDFTSWGMTPGEVVASSQGRATEVPFGSISCTFKGTTCGAILSNFTIGPFGFNVRFGFDDGVQLNSVLLTTSGDNFYELERALTGAFGSPASSDGGPLPSRIWRDTAKGNQVRLIRILDETIIEYKPIVTGF